MILGGADARRGDAGLRPRQRRAPHRAGAPGAGAGGGAGLDRGPRGHLRRLPPGGARVPDGAGRDRRRGDGPGGPALRRSAHRGRRPGPDLLYRHGAPGARPDPGAPGARDAPRGGGGAVEALAGPAPPLGSRRRGWPPSRWRRPRGALHSSSLAAARPPGAPGPVVAGGGDRLRDRPGGVPPAGPHRRALVGPARPADADHRRRRPDGGRDAAHRGRPGRPGDRGLLGGRRRDGGDDRAPPGP